MNQVVLLQNWSNVCETIHNNNLADWAQFSSVKDKLVPQAMSDGFLLLTIDTEFLRRWTIDNFQNSIQTALFLIFNKEYFVQIELDSTPYCPPNTQQTQQANQNENPLQNQGIPTSTFNEGNIQKNEFIPVAGVTPVFNQPQAGVASNVAREATQPQLNNPQAAMNPMQEAAVVAPITQQPVNVANFSCEAVQEEPIPATSIAPSLTFESFVIGDSNRMAYSMAVQVAENPGDKVLNPLFIYGKSGLGKTHLLRAIQNYVLETRPSAKVIYVDTNDLVNDYTQAAAEHDRQKLSFSNFRKKYEEADLLLIDDVQFLQGKKQTLDNVFQILNNLVTSGKQIVFSADRAPKVIDIDERYTSRFLQGGTCDIQPPELETKIAIIKSYIKEYNSQSLNDHLWIPEDIITFIAQCSGSNIRELKGAITMIIYKYSFAGEDIDKEELKHTLLNHFTSIKTNITVEDIQKIIEDYYKITHADLVGKSRAQNIAKPRQIAFYLCRTVLDLPYETLGKKFNNHHSTVLYGVNKIEQELMRNRELAEEIEVLKKLIQDL
ncbi:MAG: chromosomal replication initiator protein DnaA [Phoenicibacter congonensis]|uniref:Chromosomal replication initiator protein DnaA n=1 Tax=Phoenicibacter congonensis TaxID=1944646 RepID=A0AA43RHW1_9ACTN|nr:chromosomal replication initiator protein DnaA [Phoenicibacter congonensis]